MLRVATASLILLSSPPLLPSLLATQTLFVGVEGNIPPSAKRAFEKGYDGAVYWSHAPGPDGTPEYLLEVVRDSETLRSRGNLLEICTAGLVVSQAIDSSSGQAFATVWGPYQRQGQDCEPLLYDLAVEAGQFLASTIQQLDHDRVGEPGEHATSRSFSFWLSAAAVALLFPLLYRLRHRAVEALDGPVATEETWDVFVSYASEDADALAQPLAKALRARGISVWEDSMISTGDSVRRSIEMGLSKSRHAVVIITPNSLLKPWPQIEIDALFGTLGASERKVLPILSGITLETLTSNAPLLAALNPIVWTTACRVADKLLLVLRSRPR